MEGQTWTKTDRYSDGIDLLKGLLPVEENVFGGLNLFLDGIEKKSKLAL